MLLSAIKTSSDPLCSIQLRSRELIGEFSIELHHTLWYLAMLDDDDDDNEDLPIIIILEPWQYFLNQRDSCCHHQFSSSLNKDRNYSYFFQKKSLTPSEHVENKCGHSPIFSISIDTTHLHAWILCWKDYSIDCIAVTLIPWSGTIYDTDLVLVEINDLDARRESHSVTQLDKATFYLPARTLFLWGQHILPLNTLRWWFDLFDCFTLKSSDNWLLKAYFQK